MNYRFRRLFMDKDIRDFRDLWEDFDVRVWKKLVLEKYKYW